MRGYASILWGKRSKTTESIDRYLWSQWQVKKLKIPFDFLICVRLTVFPLYLGLGSSTPLFWTLLFSVSRSHLSWWTRGQFLRVPAEGVAHVRQDGYRSPQDLWWRHRGMLTSLVYVVDTTPVPQKCMFYLINFIRFCICFLWIWWQQQNWVNFMMLQNACLECSAGKQVHW